MLQVGDVCMFLRLQVGNVYISVGPHGTRKVAVEDFVTAPGQTVLAPNELLVAG